MQNELQVMTFTEMSTMAKMFADSGMFVDAKSAGQAIVKIQAGKEIGIPPFAAMSGIHIIQGKPTIGAGLIASMVKGSGKYDYRVTEMTDKNCSIDFFQGDQKIGTSAFSITDATKAGTKNIDKFPKNMLFARAISNGVKWYCPDVFAGPVYVPEEMPDIKTEDIKHEEVTLPPCTEKNFGTLLMKIQSAAEDKRPELVVKMKATYTLTAEQLAQLHPYEAVVIAQQA